MATKNLEQNLNSGWLEWRHKGIGGSDVAKVLNISPYGTPLSLYDEKILPVAPVHEENPAMAIGKRSEPLARAEFELRMGREFPPGLACMDGYPYMLCSLDGRHRESNELVEFKYTGKKKEIPPHYHAQMNHQMLITNAKLCWYQSYEFKNEIVTLHEPIEVLPDRILQKKILSECIKFWDGVIKRKPPEPTDRDFVLLHADGLSEKLAKWKRLKMEVAGLQLQLEEIETYAKGLVTNKRMIADGIRFTRIDRAGAINYSAIPVLKDLDLESFRKPGSSYIKMGE